MLDNTPPPEPDDTPTSEPDDTTSPEPDDSPSPEPDDTPTSEPLDELRRRILEVDDQLIRLVGERRDLVLEVGRMKAELGLPVMDPGREAQVVRRAAERAREAGVDQEMVRDVIWRIIAAAREAQEHRTSWGPPEAPRP